GLLDVLHINGGSSGLIDAGDVHVITVTAGFGNKVLQIIEAGVEYQVQAAPVAGGAMPGTILFALVYDSQTGPVPHLAIRISNSGTLVELFFALTLFVVDLSL